MRRRAVSIFVIIVMIVTMLGSQGAAFAFSEQDTYIKVSNASAAPGEEITIDLSIHNNPGVLGTTIKVDFDSSLTLVDAQSGEAFSALTMTKPGKLLPGCRFAWDGQELNQEDIADGKILSLTFKIPEDAENSEEYAVTAFCEDPIDINLDPLEIGVENGAITVLSFMPGDANGDSKVNTTDVIVTRRHIAGGYNVSINEQAANVNGDTKVNMTDVILLRRYIAGGYGVNLTGEGSQEHTHSLKYSEKVDATCTESGSIEYWMCTSCGKYFTDVNGLNEITSADTVIEASGHTIVTDPRVEPTATETGLTEGSHCSVCNEIIVAQQELPVLDGDRYEITYHLYDGDNYLKSVGVQNTNPASYDSATGLKLKNLSAEGYIFEGWYDGEGSNGELIKTIAAGEIGDIELYARWRAREYTITFDSPLVPKDSVKYTVDKGATLSNLSLFGYNFMGWSDENANRITKIPKGSTGDITLYANWTSKRNQTRTVKKLGQPIKYEDQEKGQYYFMYEIGQIENVPLYTMKNFGNSAGISITETITKTDSISEEQSKSIVNTIAKATTRTNSWTLSKDWNDSLTEIVTHTDETGVVTGTSRTDVSSDSTVNITSVSGGGSAGFSVTNTTTSSDSLTGTLRGGVEAPVGVGKASFEVEASANHTESETNSDTVSGTSNWNTTGGKNVSHESGSNTTTSKSLSKTVSDTYGYNKTHSEGGSESVATSDSLTTSSSDEYASSLVYSKGQTETTTKSYTNANAPEGYYRLVCAGTVHVFAVVGYDVVNKDYFVYTFGVQDDETYDFVDYSKSTANFDDEENGVLPFEVPYEVKEYIDDVTLQSKGIEIDKSTGKVTGFNGIATDVIIPDYIVVDDVSGNKDVVKIKGIETDAFRGNTSIKSVRLGKYVEELPSSAFEGCTSLKSLKAPSIKKIGSKAFKGCGSLTSVPDNGVTTIGDEAFSDCTSLNGYKVSSEVNSLGTNSFKDVKKIEVDASTPSIVSAATQSGAKTIVMYTDDIAGELKNRVISVPSSVTMFEWNGGGKTYNNVILTSKAGKTVLNKISIESNGQNPVTISSEEIILGEVSVSTAAWPLILTADTINMTIESNVHLSSTGKGALLTKSASLTRYSQQTTAKMNLTGDAYVCGSITDPNSILKFTNSTYKTVNVNASSFDSLINDSLEWVLASKVPAGATIVAEKWTYDQTTTKTSSSNTMAGYTLYDTTWTWGSYGAWSSWSNTKVTESESRKVETKTIPATYKTQYKYSRYAQNSNNTGVIGPCKGTWSGVYCQYYFDTGWSDSRKSVSGSQNSSQMGGTFYLYENNQWFNETTRQVVKTAAYTQYRYCDRSKVYTYHFKKVEKKESGTAVTASGNISNVQKWVKYIVS